MTQIFVAPTTCPNCGRDLEGAYCAACGQKVAPLNPTFHDLMHDIVHEFLHVDGKIFHSVRLLLTRPGFLSYEYFNGRRARYVSPLRLYLIFSVVFFGMTAITSKPLTAEDRAELEEVGRPMGALAEADFAHDLETWLPRAMFVLVPVLAALTALVTRAERRNYPLHLYFGLHVHAAVFAIFALLVLLRYGDSEVMDGIADTIGLVAVSWYLVVAFHTAYGGTWRRAAVRAAIVGVSYGFAVVLTLVALFGAVLLLVSARAS